MVIRVKIRKQIFDLPLSLVTNAAPNENYSLKQRGLWVM